MEIKYWVVEKGDVRDMHRPVGDDRNIIRLECQIKHILDTFDIDKNIVLISEEHTINHSSGIFHYLTARFETSRQLLSMGRPVNFSKHLEEEFQYHEEKITKVLEEVLNNLEYMFDYQKYQKNKEFYQNMNNSLASKKTTECSRMKI